MHHIRKKRMQYHSLNEKDKKKSICSLCGASKEADRIEETYTMVVIRNRMPYDFFEGHKTTGEHYMVIPREHRGSFTEFTEHERREYFDLCAKYEARGFNICARGVGSSTRSQPHQHTHFIKLDPKQPKFFLYIQKPYITLHH